MPRPWLQVLLLILFATPFPAALTPHSPTMSERDSSVMTDASPQPRLSRGSGDVLERRRRLGATVGESDATAQLVDGTHKTAESNWSVARVEESLSKNGIRFVEDETMLDVWASPHWHGPPVSPTTKADAQEPVSLRDFLHPVAASSARSHRLSAHTSTLPASATPHPTSATPLDWGNSGRGAEGRATGGRDLFFGTPTVTQPGRASRRRGEASSTAWSDDALSLEELLSSRDASPEARQGGVASVQVRFWLQS